MQSWFDLIGCGLEFFTKQFNGLCRIATLDIALEADFSSYSQCGFWVGLIAERLLNDLIEFFDRGLG